MPPRVYILFKSYAISEVPEVEEDFKLWLHGEYKKMDEKFDLVDESLKIDGGEGNFKRIV